MWELGRGLLRLRGRGPGAFSGWSASPGNFPGRWAGLGVWSGASERGVLPDVLLRSARLCLSRRSGPYPRKARGTTATAIALSAQNRKGVHGPHERDRQQDPMRHLHPVQNRNPPPPPNPNPQKHRPPLLVDAETAGERRWRGRDVPKAKQGSAETRSMVESHEKSRTPLHAVGLNPLPWHGLRPLPCRAAGTPTPASPQRPEFPNTSRTPSPPRAIHRAKRR